MWNEDTSTQCVSVCVHEYNVKYGCICEGAATERISMNGFEIGKFAMLWFFEFPEKELNSSSKTRTSGQQRKPKEA